MKSEANRLVMRENEVQDFQLAAENGSERLMLGVLALMFEEGGSLQIEADGLPPIRWHFDAGGFPSGAEPSVPPGSEPNGG